MGSSKRVLLKSDGRMTIPQEIRKKLKLEEDSLLDLEIYSDDKILITILRR